MTGHEDVQMFCCSLVGIDCTAGELDHKFFTPHTLWHENPRQHWYGVAPLSGTLIEYSVKLLLQDKKTLISLISIQWKSVGAIVEKIMALLNVALSRML